MEKFLSRLTLIVNEEEFDAIMNLALEANTTITDMLCMFITDLVGTPGTTEDFRKHARGWYDTLHPAESKPLGFPVWLKRNNSHKLFFHALSEIFSYVSEQLKSTPESGMSFDEMCMNQVQFLVECHFCPLRTEKRMNDLDISDFPLSVQEDLALIFDQMKAFYTQYVDEQKIEETRFSCEEDMNEVVYFWRDYKSRYYDSEYLK